MSAAGGTWGREPSSGRWVRARPVVLAGCASSLPALQSSHNGPIVPSRQAVWRRFLGHPYPPPPNRGQINPLEDRPGEGPQGATLPIPPFGDSRLWEVTFHPRVPSNRLTPETGVSHWGGSST